MYMYTHIYIYTIKQCSLFLFRAFARALIHLQSLHPRVSACVYVQNAALIKMDELESIFPTVSCVPICVWYTCVGVRSRKCKALSSSVETKASPSLDISAWVLSFHWRLRLPSTSVKHLRGNILELPPPRFPSPSIRGCSASKSCKFWSVAPTAKSLCRYQQRNNNFNDVQ